jgi:4-diphosphocytidyl-2C-methyl-D-erythritol kinase
MRRAAAIALAALAVALGAAGAQFRARPMVIPAPGSLPNGAQKRSTADVYAAFDARDGARGWDARRAALLDALDAVRRPRDLAALPANDLVSSPLAAELQRLGAFRADVSGAGPTVYGLFHHRRDAHAARRALRHRARTWLTAPAWYG